MSGVGVRVSREGPGLSLPSSLAGTSGSVTGDNIDWVDGGDAPGTITNTGDFELKNEGGQDHIDAHGSMGSAETFDPTDGNVHTGTLNANCTFTLNPPTGTGFCSLELWLSQDGTGGWVITWPGTVTEIGTPDTTLSTTSRVVVETVDGGTSWLATWVGAEGVDAELNIEGGQSVIKAHGSMGSTETFDPTDGNVHTGTLNAACTFTLNAPAGSGACILELWLTEDSTGGWAVTWPGSVTEQGTHTTTLGTTQRVILETIDGGTSWIATWIGSGGSAITVKDEGTPLATAATSLDFVGPLVTASGTGAAKTVTVTGALDDLTDVTITSPATSDRLRYSGSAWVNSAALWVPVMVEDGTTGLWYVAVTGDGDAVMTEVS